MSGFNNPIVGGNSFLIRPAIQSPNYVPGVSGWTINRDGSAEFNNLTVRANLTAGTITNSSIGGSAITNCQIANSDFNIVNSQGHVFVYQTTGQTVVPFTANGNWTCPVGITQAKIECVGGGKGGWGTSSTPISPRHYYAGSGGTGGEYASEPTYATTPGHVYPIVVGAGGAGGPNGALGHNQGGNGALSSFNGTDVVGNGGGTGVLSTNTVHFSGGNGGTGQSGTQGGTIDFPGAGGGGAGGPNGSGNIGVATGAGGTSGGAPGGNGGSGGAIGTVGNSGSNYGGGGGGGGVAGSTNTFTAGGSGASGLVQITYGGTYNLIASIAGAAGTDQYGNNYPAGINPPGIPAGGTTGQDLTKNSNANYDASWSNPVSRVGRIFWSRTANGIATGGTTDFGTPPNTEWANGSILTANQTSRLAIIKPCFVTVQATINEASGGLAGVTCMVTYTNASRAMSYVYTGVQYSGANYWTPVVFSAFMLPGETLDFSPRNGTTGTVNLTVFAYATFLDVFQSGTIQT